jgi:tRNA U34 5-methylaminomethyl-2-thiouridine-forming methyltransferase MnmC
LKDCGADRSVLTARFTADGSFSLHSDSFAESFHSSGGALEEANNKFVLPAQLDRFSSSSSIRVLDVCFGLGYNTAALIAALPKLDAPALECWGLELDPLPLQLALAEPRFRALWPVHVVACLEAISARGCWQDASRQQSVQMLWGDARQQLRHLPTGLRLDLILLDAFSPGKCPQLWSEEFLLSLADLLAPGGRLLTYCRAAAVRSSLRRAGLELALAFLPSQKKVQGWSSGTMALRPSNDGCSVRPEMGAGLAWFKRDGGRASADAGWCPLPRSIRH